MCVRSSPRWSAVRSTAWATARGCSCGRTGTAPTRCSWRRYEGATMREDAQFTSHGVRCSAWVYRPDGSAGGPATPARDTSAPAAPAPAIVMAHGFGCIRDLRLPAYAERFRDAGFVVVVFDYR